MHTSPPITIAVAQFEDLLARGLRGLIETDTSLEIVARDVELGRIGVILRAHRPRVAILDVDALTVLGEVRELTRRYPDTRLVLLVTHPTTAECVQALAFGASAYLGRDTQGRDVLTAIHLASRGLQLIPRGSPDPAGRPPPGAQLLTPREAEVLPMLQQGSSNAQIAVALYVTVETVRSHARNIYRKLGVSSRRDLGPITPGRPLQDVTDSRNADSDASPPSRRRLTSARDRHRRPGSLRR